ncbi:hypothetical protein ACO0RG_004047 [Hanseniaspora osmophila]
MSSLEHALAGATGGALSISLTYPLLTVTTNLQTKEEVLGNKPRSVKNVFLDLWETKSLYKGLESSLYGITLTNFIYYFFYEYCSKILLTRKLNKKNNAQKSQKMNTIESMFCGFIAGTITATLTNPVWVANTKLTTSTSLDKKASTYQAIVQIVKEEGFLQLFKGLKPALVLVINPIIQYTVFEQLKNTVALSRDSLSPAMGFVLGAVSKLTATGITYPYITLKTRMHLESNGADGKSTDMMTMLRDIIQQEGLWSGLYRGVTVKLVQSVLTAAFLFFFKEGIVQGIVKLTHLKKQSRLVSTISRKKIA